MFEGRSSAYSVEKLGFLAILVLQPNNIPTGSRRQNELQANAERPQGVIGKNGYPLSGYRFLNA